MPLVSGGLNVQRTEGGTPMTVAELASCLRGVENQHFPSTDEGVFEKEYWRNAPVEIVIENDDGHWDWYHVVEVSYSCISPEPMIRVRKTHDE